jgi:hypothetical protein
MADNNNFQTRRRKLKHHLLWILPALFIVAGVFLKPWYEDPDNFFRSRNRPPQAYFACVNNLRMIDAAKEQSALAGAWANGAPCNTTATINTINMYIRGSITPICPEGGMYIYGPIGTNPVCTAISMDRHGKVFYHRLPVYGY